MLGEGDCCEHVGGTPTAAVETTALPICNCIVRASLRTRNFLLADFPLFDFCHSPR